MICPRSQCHCWTEQRQEPGLTTPQNDATRTHQGCRKPSSSWSNLQALTDRSGSNLFLNPLPKRAENFPKNAAQICIKCLLWANHTIRQQECREEKVCGFKELTLMGDRDNYKEVTVMTQVSPGAREEVREDFLEECYRLSWVPWEKKQ